MKSDKRKKYFLFILSFLLIIILIIPGILYYILFNHGSQLEARFQKTIKNEGFILYQSYNGRWIGTDSDCEIMFLANSKVKIVFYSVRVVKYEGTFKFIGNQVIKLNLPKYNFFWPPMLLGLHFNSLILNFFEKYDPKITQEIDSPHGKNSSFWPFKRISKEQKSRFFN